MKSVTPAFLLADTAHEVFEALHDVMHLYRAQQYRILRDGPHDISHMENRVLGYVARHPGTTQRDLVEHSGRDKAQLARLVRGLRDKGLLVGDADPLDRRSVRLVLTPAGEKIQSALRQRGDWLMGEAVRSLSENQRQQLLTLMGSVRQNLQSLD